MIKINLLATKKQTKAKVPAAGSPAGGGLGGGQNLLLIAILLVGVAVSGFWWYSLSTTKSGLIAENTRLDTELERLKEVRKKGEQYKKQKQLLERKINLITELKKQQTAPVHIIDQVSKNVPEFLWLESMQASKNKISINGKATTFNEVSNFYRNLDDSGYFADIELGRTYDADNNSVAFSLTCQFIGAGGDAEPAEGAVDNVGD